MILDSPIISGSSTVTGDLTVLGTLIANVSGSSISASYATNAELLDGLDSTSFTTTSSFNTVSGSFSTRVTNLESFSSSLDATFATDAQLTAVSQSFSSSLSTVSESLSSRVANNEATGSSLTTASSSFSTRVTNTEATASSLVTASGSFSTRTTNLETASGSFSTRVTNTEATASSLTTASSSFSTRVTNNESNISSLQTASGSFSTRITNAESSITSLNSKTGSYATTGSNTFVNTQYISAVNNPVSFTSTASLYTDGGVRVTKDMYVSGTAYFNNVTVYGTQSVQYITSSQLNISTNLISVNTDTPTIRFGGLAVYDSGSTGLSGSLLWDSEQNHWVYTNPSGSTYSGGMLISGPRASSLGSEQGTTLNSLMKGQGGDHITSSGIFESGSGNVGIGTSIPAYKLDVQGTGNFTGQLVLNASNNQVRSGNELRFYRADNGIYTQLYDGGNTNGFVIDNTNGNGFNFQHSGTSQFRITDSGNVGIGTTTPTTKLHVSGTTGGVFEVDGASAINALYVSASGNVGIGTNVPAVTLQVDASGGGVIRATRTGVGSGYLQMEADGTNGSLTANNILYFNAGGSTRMTILSNGNVGIGTTTPRSLFHANSGTVSTPRGSGFTKFFFSDNNAITTYFEIQTPTGSSGDILFSDGNSGDYGIVGYDHATDSMRFYTKSAINMFISGSGAVGIGTTSPGAHLHVYSAGGPSLWLTAGGSGTGGLRIIKGDSGTAYINNQDSVGMQFQIAGDTKMVIESSGNIGIGTTSPSSLLQVGSTTVSTGGGPLRVYGFDGAADFYTTRQENNFNAALYLHNNPSGTVGNGTGILFRARSSSTDSRVQGAVYTSWITSTDSGRTSKLVFQTVDSGTNSDKVTILGNGNVGIGITAPTSRLHVTGSTDAVRFEGSGSNIFAVDGTSGRLFSVDDDLTNSLFSVNTIAGLPVIEAFADNTVRLGKYTAGVGVMNITGSYVGIGTSVPAAALHVAGNEYIAKASGGGTFKQVVVGQITAASSGTAKKIAYVGFSHSVRVYVWANQSAAHGSSAIADIVTLYGSSVGGTIAEANFGNVTDIVVAYNNGGSPAYTIDVTLTYSGTAPTINYVIEGISWDNNIYTL